MSKRIDVEQIKENWREASSEDVVQAATVDKNEYPPEVQAIITIEVKQRGLSLPDIKLTETSFEQRANEKTQNPPISHRLKNEVLMFWEFITCEIPRTLIWFLITNLKMGIGVFGFWLITQPIVRFLEKTLPGGTENGHLQTIQVVRGLLMICIAVYILAKFCAYPKKKK